MVCFVCSQVVNRNFCGYNSVKLYQFILGLFKMSEDKEKYLLDVLKIIDDKCEVSSTELSTILGLPHNSIVGFIKSLSTYDNLINVESKNVSSWELTDEGKFIVEKGSYEALVFDYVKKSGSLPMADVMKNVSNAKIGFSKAMAKGWIKNDKGTVTPAVESIVDEVKSDLISLMDNKVVSDNNKTEYKKRKLIKEVTLTVFVAKKGDGFTLHLEKPETELTPEMIANGSWKTKTFKPYNFEAQGVPPPRGHLHHLLKLRAEFRRIFLELGYSEMDTKNYVASSFWNFDALFQPQQHPARDAHDTFFLKTPKEARNFPPDYVEKVKTVHSVGNYGSIGYKYNWDINEAKKNILRTHTTMNSAKCLYALGQAEKFTPVKMFSIDRVFRNETLDATHLAEFNQIEGLVADYNLSLGDLIGVINQFFSKIGFDKVKFKPAYNPYTEPSMEIFCYHEGLGKWIEVGNSGMFRPEMLLPLGLPPSVNVIAWGLSLERPAMIKYGFNNIRDLVGPKVQLSTIFDDPICKF